MKNLKFLALALAGFTLMACSDDDNDNTNANADMVGTYRMTSWNAPMAVDFNGDGTANTNMMNESPCYNESVMNMNSDGTWTMTYNYVNIDGTVSCQSETTHGTWTRQGNAITASRLQGGQTTNTMYNLSAGSQTTLTRSEGLWNYPSINSSNQQVYSTGTVNMVMTRQ